MNSINRMIDMLWEKMSIEMIEGNNNGKTRRENYLIFLKEAKELAWIFGILTIVLAAMYIFLLNYNPNANLFVIIVILTIISLVLENVSFIFCILISMLYKRALNDFENYLE